MPYFPKREEQLYRCQGCGGWFMIGIESCPVLHAPGTCCHKYETPVMPPVPRARDGDSPQGHHACATFVREMAAPTQPPDIERLRSDNGYTVSEYRWVQEA